MKKVLVIAPYAYLPYFSGGQKSIAQFLEYLGKKTQLTVISVSKNDFTLAKTYKGLPMLSNSFFRYADYSLIRKITALIKEHQFDTVIWEHPYYSWLAYCIRKRTGVKTIFHTHNIEYKRFRSTGKWWWPVLKFYERRCLRKADALFFISREDMEFATSTWHIDPAKCTQLAFGVEIAGCPADRPEAKRIVQEKHGINPGEKILFFNGLLNYQPNTEALDIILEKINPLLQNAPDFQYKILICGKGLPDSYDNLARYSDKNVIYAGFVEDIELYFRGVDMFISPVLSGGGVKTKMVEAIAFGNTVVSTESSATGIDQNACGKKLLVIKDGDWENMARLIINYKEWDSVTPVAFYDIYNWEKIIEKVIPVIR